MTVGRVLAFACEYQLGNNPGLFQGTDYVGLDITLPMSVTWVDQLKPDVHFFIETHDIETWGSWRGHPVSLNGQEVGRLKDPDDVTGRLETFDIVISMANFLKITGYAPGKPCQVTFQIVLERQPQHPAYVDDFVLTRFETSDSAVLRLGW